MRWRKAANSQRTRRQLQINGQTVIRTARHKRRKCMERRTSIVDQSSSRAKTLFDQPCAKVTCMTIDKRYLTTTPTRQSTRHMAVLTFAALRGSTERKSCVRAAAGGTYASQHASIATRTPKQRWHRAAPVQSVNTLLLTTANTSSQQHEHHIEQL